jgi:hypothetical protein
MTLSNSVTNHGQIKPDNEFLGGTLITLDNFKFDVESGMFIDYDGFGYFFKDGEVFKNQKVYPSEFRLLDTKDFTHVLWYNR